MAAIFRELVLTWKGGEYRVKPTMQILNRIEQDVSLSMVAYRISTGQPPLSQLATILCHFLTAAGVKDVTAEEVYAEMLNGDDSTVRDAAGAVMLAAFPQFEKKDVAPSTKKKRADTGK